MPGIKIPALTATILVALALCQSAAQAQTRAHGRARASVTILQPAVPFAAIDRAVAAVASDTGAAPSTWLPAGARLRVYGRVDAATARADATVARSERGRPTVRVITLEYAAN